MRRISRGVNQFMKCCELIKNRSEIQLAIVAKVNFFNERRVIVELYLPHTEHEIQINLVSDHPHIKDIVKKQEEGQQEAANREGENTILYFNLNDYFDQRRVIAQTAEGATSRWRNASLQTFQTVLVELRSNEYFSMETDCILVDPLNIDLE